MRVPAGRARGMPGLVVLQPESPPANEDGRSFPPFPGANSAAIGPAGFEWRRRSPMRMRGCPARGQWAGGEGCPGGSAGERRAAAA